MKTQFVLFSIMLSLFVGCAADKSTDFRPVEGNFGYVTHVKGFTDGSLTSGFCYRDQQGKTTIVWPYLEMIWGKNCVVDGDTALLVGGISRLYPDGKERLTARLIAFKGPSGPPMDITDQLLRKYYAGTGLTLTNFIWDSFVSLTKTNAAVRIAFSSDRLRPGTKNVWDPFDSSLDISWQDIGVAMQDVKKNGKAKREKRSGFAYLQKD